ncbi:MAG: SIMPL domain-containing protein [Vicinamibacteria bacterium]|nr:SIMPL domain-containing protein [Vicinamibacteria bacterium]
MRHRWPLIALLFAPGLSYGATRTSVVTPAPCTVECDEAALLEVTGTASVKAVPDQVVITATLISVDRRASRAFDDNQAKMSIAVSRLEAIGLAKTKITTEALAVTPAYNDKGKVDRFTVSRRLKIFQDDLAAISPVLDAIVDSGIEEIGAISFVVRDMDRKYDEALRQALEDCRAQAHLMTQTMGVRIIGIRSLGSSRAGEGGTSGGPLREGVENQVIVPNEVSARVHVRAVYEVKYVAP